MIEVEYGNLDEDNGEGVEDYSAYVGLEMTMLI